jgi:hypothetical protein
MFIRSEILMAVSTEHAVGLVACEDEYFGAEILTFRRKLLPRPTLQNEVSGSSCKIILSRFRYIL